MDALPYEELGTPRCVPLTTPRPGLMVRINKPEPPQSAAEERWQAEGGANVGSVTAARAARRDG